MDDPLLPPWPRVATVIRSNVFPMHTASTLVGGSLYWLLFNSSSTIGVLELDLDRQHFSVIAIPLDVSNLLDYDQFRVMRCKGGELGFLFVSSSTIQLWKRVTDSDGGAGWVLGETIDVCKLLSLDPEKGPTLSVRACGFDEDDNVLLLQEGRSSAIMIRLDSMQLEKHSGIYYHSRYHPFRWVYTAGIGTEGKQDGAEHNMIV